MKVLQFSGGKDSLACLYLFRNEWDTIKVVWVNSGAAYPEMIEYMEKWKKILPHFIEVKSDQPNQIKNNGYPTDINIINDTVFGRQFTDGKGPLVQSYLNCCSANIWLPMMHAIQELGATEIIRGQRKDDNRQAKIQDGAIINGVKFTFPIFEWSESDVFSYLNEVNADMPEAYSKGEKTGRDCWDCTAYLDENAVRIKNLPDEKRKIVLSRLGEIKKTILENPLVRDY